MMNGIGNSCGYSNQQQQQQQQQPPLIIINGGTGGGGGGKSVCNKCRCCSSHNDDDDEGDYQKIRSGIYPPGYTFNPDDVDIINCYLKKKIMNEALPHNEVMKNIILEVNLYDFNPDQLAEYYKQLNGKKQKERCYFFTPRNRKSLYGNRPTRLARDGFWSTSHSKAIKEKSDDGPAIGLKTVLVWYKGKAKMKANKTDWIMYEYTCTKGHRRKRANANDMMLDEWVLCEIHKSGRSGTTEYDGAPRAEENTVVASGQSYEPFNDQGGVMIGTNNNGNNDTVMPNPIERLMGADQYVTSNLQVGVVDPEFDQTYFQADYAENEYLTLEDLGLI